MIQGRTERATIHYCESCGDPSVQRDGEDLPVGFYFNITWVKDEVEIGKFFVCSEECMRIVGIRVIADASKTDPTRDAVVADYVGTVAEVSAR